jgi:hypothetical protein
MPETTENYHHIPVRDKELFVEGSFRTINISKEKGIKAIIGKLKTDAQGSTVVQKYLFDIEKWSMAEAKEWVKEHGKANIESLMKLYEEIDISGSDENKVTKFFRIKVASVDEDKHTARVYISTEEKDRDDEIILLSAWKKDLNRYKAHPVLLSSHNYQSIQSQIGEAGSLGFDDKGFYADFKWYEGEGNKEADWGWNLAKKGKAMFSVGFRAHEALMGEAIPVELRKKDPRRVFTRVELLEVSQVVVGSNQGAIQMGYASPNQATLDYAFEVVKSFGADIPDFNAIPKAPEPVKPPEPIKEKINSESLIIEPVQIQDMKTLTEIMSIWKSGRVISAKNKEVLQSAREKLASSIEAIDTLLKLTEPEEPPKEDGKIQNEVDAFLKRNAHLIKS